MHNMWKYQYFIGMLNLENLEYIILQIITGEEELFCGYE